MNTLPPDSTSSITATPSTPTTSVATPSPGHRPLSRPRRGLVTKFVTTGLVLAAGTRPLLAQAFTSTDLKTGISNSLAVIMMFGFILGISSVIYGGFAIRRGDVDQGKMSIIGGAIIAAAPALIFAFFKIFGIESNSSVGVGSF